MNRENYARLCWAVGLLVWLMPSILAAQRAVVDLDLRKGDSLRWVYESGLRPKIGYGSTHSQCDVLNEIIRLILPDGSAFTIPSRDTQFNVNAKD